MFFSQYESPVGPLTLRADGAALTGLAFGSCAEPPSSLPLFDESFAWLDAFLRPGPRPHAAPASCGHRLPAAGMAGAFDHPLR